MLKEKLDSAFAFLQTKAPPLIGVDISSSAIKLVELSETGKGAYRLERYTIEPLVKDLVTDGNIVNLDQVSEALRRAHKRLGSRNKHIAMALPTAMVITKKIIVPAGQTEEELELQVEAEANQYIPFALDEVNLDFQILGPAPNNAEDVEVLIAASRKEKVDDRVALADNAGLRPQVMDVESYATEEAFRMIAPSLPANARDQNVALVDIGAHVILTSTCCATIKSCSPATGLRRQPVDPRHSARVQLIAGRGRIGEENAGLPENYDADVLQPFMETLALEVTRALQFSSPRRRTARSTRLSSPAAARCCPGSTTAGRQARRRHHDRRQSIRQHGDVRSHPAAPARGGRAAATDRLRPWRCAGSNSHDPRQSSAPPRAETPGASAPVHLAGRRTRGARRRDRRPVHRHCRPDRKPERAQHAAEDRDRQARRADQGDRQAARADAALLARKQIVETLQSNRTG
jgi:type IV pilus assembly protein PilM